jgi:hypothetical protein
MMEGEWKHNIKTAAVSEAVMKSAEVEESREVNS